MSRYFPNLYILTTCSFNSHPFEQSQCVGNVELTVCLNYSILNHRPIIPMGHNRHSSVDFLISIGLALKISPI